MTEENTIPYDLTALRLRYEPTIILDTKKELVPQKREGFLVKGGSYGTKKIYGNSPDSLSPSVLGACESLGSTFSHLH